MKALNKQGDYSEKQKASGTIKIYFKNEPISSPRNHEGTYINDFNKDRVQLITFDEFVRLHINWREAKP